MGVFLSFSLVVAVAAQNSVHSLVQTIINQNPASSPAKTIRKIYLQQTPTQLAENTILFGNRLLKNFKQGKLLLTKAEEENQTHLSTKSYTALMQIAIAENLNQDVLNLLARMRAHKLEPTPSALRTSMTAAANLGDWGGVSRLFSELTGTHEPAMALELIGAPEYVDEALDALCENMPNAPAQLSPADADALMLALRAYCHRGDSRHAIKALARSREFNLPLTGATLTELCRIVLAKPCA